MSGFCVYGMTEALAKTLAANKRPATRWQTSDKDIAPAPLYQGLASCGKGQLGGQQPTDAGNVTGKNFLGV